MKRTVVIVKFHARGKGGGSGPVDYLLGEDRDRDQAQVLRGDPEQIRELIDSVQFAQRYKSGVLSFEESDISPEQKQQVMDSFQEALLPGLDSSNYGILWVEHRDKDRLELNFVVPTVELQTGKRLQPYYDPIDRQRINDWKQITNHEQGFSDPDDPAKRRTLNIRGVPPESTKQAQEYITAGVLSKIASGDVTDRLSLIHELQQEGFEIARTTKNSISIKNPNGARNIRLSGAIYERDFRAGPDVAAEIEKCSAEHREGAQARISAVAERYRAAVGVRAGKNRDSYQRRKPQPQSEPERSPGRPLANPNAQPDSVAPGIPDGGWPDSVPGIPGTVPGRGRRDERAGGLDALRDDQRQPALVHDQGGRLDDRVRTGAVERARAAGRSAEGIERQSRAAAAADRPVNQVGRIVERIGAACERVVQQCRAVAEALRNRSVDRDQDNSPGMRGPGM